MIVSIDPHRLSFGDCSVTKLAVSDLHRIFGGPATVEHIRLRDGGTRFRESWPNKHLDVLRDEDQPDALCLSVGFPEKLETTNLRVRGSIVADDEAAFKTTFPFAEKGIGHSYTVTVGNWRITADFKKPSRMRGKGSCIYRIFRLIIHEDKPA